MTSESGLRAPLKLWLKFLLTAVKWFFIIACLFVASLFFREQRLPGSWVDSIVAGVSSTNIVVRCDGASFGFRRGLRFSGVALYDRMRKNVLEPVLSVGDLSVDFLRRRVVAVEFRLPRLPDGYYESGNSERNESVEARLPEFARFKMVLVRPAILGISAEKVSADIESTVSRVDIKNVRIDWPDVDRRMKLEGFTYVDLAEQRVYGEVRGEAKQAHIRPLLVTLDVPVSLPYMDAFTEIEHPVPAFCSWDVNLVNNDFRLKLELEPKMGKYNGVPMRRAAGEISLHVYTRGDRLNYNTTIGPLKAWDTENRLLDGSVLIRGTNDVVHLDFDVDSGLRLEDALAIADCFDEGALDCLKCESVPQVSVKGTLALDEEYSADNNLSGRVSFDKGVFFGIPVRGVSFDYAYIGDKLSFTGGRAIGKDGGTVTGSAALVFPAFGGGESFSLDFVYSGGTMNELADVLEMDMGERRGKVDGRIRLSGPLESGAYSRLEGEGSIRITDGRLAQMNLFMGLTEVLAKNVPGIAGMVTQSQASADFRIAGGVVKSNNVLIEGGLVSIKAAGEYDITKDNLDFTVTVQLLKDESIIGKMVRPVMQPFSKLLMEFKVSGPIENPQWKYISVIDRVL